MRVNGEDYPIKRNLEHLLIDNNKNENKATHIRIRFKPISYNRIYNTQVFGVCIYK